jgi:hypothetical protein
VADNLLVLVEVLIEALGVVVEEVEVDILVVVVALALVELVEVLGDLDNFHLVVVVLVVAMEQLEKVVLVELEGLQLDLVVHIGIVEDGSMELQ